MPQVHASQDTFDVYYVLMKDYYGHVYAKYIGPCNKHVIVKRHIWVHKIIITNIRGPKFIWIPKVKA
uniref:Uncharacterized protein n=1 Tax=Arundo donax TaxID=35708 RepID=A0A0A9BZ35_ARUDO